LADLGLWAELMELKKKWEEDKAKVEKLKASRKFRPY
jgi:ribosomal RNA-processing protein 7